MYVSFARFVHAITPHIIWEQYHRNEQESVRYVFQVSIRVDAVWSIV